MGGSRDQRADEISRLKNEIDRLERTHRALREDYEALLHSHRTLAESAEKFRLVFDNAPLGMLHFDTAGRITACNDNFVAIIGSSRQILTGLCLLELRDPKVVAAVRNALQGETGYYEDEYHSVTADKVTPVRGFFAPLKTPDGAVTGGIGIFEDLTEQRRVMDAKRESDTRLRIIADNIPGVVYQFYARPDGAMGMYYASERVTDIFGITGDLDSFFPTFVEHVAPEDRSSFIASIERVVAERRPWDFEARFIKPSGEEMFFRGTSHPVESGDELIYNGVLLDITDRRRALEALRAERERLAVTLRSIGDGVIATDAHSRVVLINKAAEALTGWSAAEAEGCDLNEVFCMVNEKERHRCFNLLEGMLASGRGLSFEDNAVLVSRSGDEYVIAASAAPIMERSDVIGGAVLVFRDITERRRFEEEMQKSQRIETIGILAGGLAHDFNNILTAIAGNISLARLCGEEHGDVSDILNDAEKAVFRAKDITQQLLTFARGGMPVKKVSSLTSLILDSAQFVLRGSRVQCEYHLAPDLWAAEVDLGQINQVLQNLVINAEQAMTGGGVIRIVAENIMAEDQQFLPLAPGRYIRIAIIDQGPGINPAIIPKIFDPYFTTKPSGSGLGLSIAYSIVRKHEGIIDVVSHPGAGTTFIVYLPATAAPLPEPEAGPAAVPPGTGRILVMDDEDLVRDVAAKLLTRLGYEVIPARDGAEALTRFREAAEAGRPVDLAILDLTVPGSMGGRECFDALRRLDPAVRALVSSGYSNDPLMADYRSYGFAGIINKPYRFEDLQQLLHRLLRGEE